ncbi:MAG: GIY-YIG nuclease family protein [Dehalococcoidia bacterium]|jgi:AraC-like DNA-binding protein
MIYFVQSGKAGPIKIGYTAKDDVKIRINTLQTGCIEPLNLLGVMAGTELQEKALHQFFHAYRIRGEWFQPHPKLLMYIMGLILGKSESEMYNSFTQVNDIFQTNNFSVDSYLMQIDKDILAQSLENARWNITEAAKQVGLTETHRRKLPGFNPSR